jgi:hypothetical protein
MHFMNLHFGRKFFRTIGVLHYVCRYVHAVKIPSKKLHTDPNLSENEGPTYL